MGFQIKGEPITLPESQPGPVNWSNDIAAAIELARMTSPLMVALLLARDGELKKDTDKKGK